MVKIFLTYKTVFFILSNTKRKFLSKKRYTFLQQKAYMLGVALYA